MNRPNKEHFNRDTKWTMRVYIMLLEKYCDELEHKLKGEEFHAKRVLDLSNDYKKLKIELEDCRNELCLMCGRYKEEHKGACHGCRWLDD